MRPTHITLVPHTHWDREWYEPFDVFLERLVAMMDTLIELAGRGFPHFHLDGQTALIDDYLGVRPEREADVRRFVTAGQLSAGPWVTQMDEFLTSGESHVRNLEMGCRRARELGRVLEVGYLPDQFGHIGQMPQILRRAGLDRAVVWRGVPREIATTSFWWEAPDGSRVRTEYLAFSYALGGDLHRFTEPGELADALRRKVEQVAPALVGERMLIPVGSDHAGPDGSLPERLAAAQSLLPDASVRIGSLEDHLGGPPPGGLPTWHGELRSSARAHLLPNVYSSRVHQKRERGRVEALIERYAEPLAALVPGFEWPDRELERAWTLLLWNGAHDSVCGCSHDRVARDVDARYAEVRAIGEGIVERALDRLGGLVSEEGLLRFNPSPFERDGVPGLGWSVERSGAEPEEAPIELEIRDGWIVADGLALTFADEPDIGDLYNFCPAREGQEPARPDRLEVRGHRVRAAWDGLDVVARLVRRAGEPFLRLEGVVRNDRPDHRMRLHVRLPSQAQGSLAGSPFELVARPLVSEGSELESPSPTWPARHLVAAGGVAAYHEGVFEYEISDGELRLTLLRCVGTISRTSIPTRPWAAGPGTPTPEAQMIGTTAFALALGASAPPEELLRRWERFALPLVHAPAAGGGALPPSGRLLELDGEAVLSSVRRRDGGLEVRLWNPRSDGPARTRLAGRELTLGAAEIRTHRPAPEPGRPG